MSYSVGIFIFDNVEVLDFAGPYEVFTTASRVYKKLHMSSIEIPFEAFTIGKRKEPIHARAGLKIDPDYRDWETDRKSTRLNSSHRSLSRMPSSA